MPTNPRDSTGNKQSGKQDQGYRQDDTSQDLRRTPTISSPDRDTKTGMTGKDQSQKSRDEGHLDEDR